MIKVDAPQKYTALLRGSRPATARLARAPSIAILSFDLRDETPVRPIAIDRTGRYIPSTASQTAVRCARQQTAGAKIPIASDARSH
jgi:hypothetical protein